MPQEQDIKMKICLIGDSAVGKTSLIRRYVMDIFSDKYIATFGTKISKKKLKVKHKGTQKEVTLVIWDVIGQKEFRELVKEAHFYGSNGALVVCDTTRKKSLAGLGEWVKGLYSVTGKIPLVFLANKSDLEDQAEFRIEELKMFAQLYKAETMPVSAKTGQNVEEAFEAIALKVLDKGTPVSPE